MEQSQPHGRQLEHGGGKEKQSDFYRGARRPDDFGQVTNLPCISVSHPHPPTVLCENCGLGGGTGIPGVTTKGQGSPREAWPPVLSSQLHLRVAVRLPLRSMGSHYHCHMLMTPINSPSVGPMQPSALKVKGRGTGSGWLFSRMTVQACLCGLYVYKLVYSLSLRCLVYMEHVHPSLVYATCIHRYTLCMCALCVYKVFMYTKSKSCIYVPSTICAFYLCTKCVQINYASTLCLCTRTYICVQMLCVSPMFEDTKYLHFLYP